MLSLYAEGPASGFSSGLRSRQRGSRGNEGHTPWGSGVVTSRKMQGWTQYSSSGLFLPSHLCIRATRNTRIHQINASRTTPGAFKTCPSRGFPSTSERQLLLGQGLGALTVLRSEEGSDAGPTSSLESGELPAKHQWQLRVAAIGVEVQSQSRASAEGLAGLHPQPQAWRWSRATFRAHMPASLCLPIPTALQPRIPAALHPHAGGQPWKSGRGSRVDRADPT